MNRLGFIVLSILHQEGAASKLSAMTVHEIALTEELNMRENTIFKKIKEFERSGYVCRGLKEGRADTFYITPEGCKYLEKEKK